MTAPEPVRTPVPSPCGAPLVILADWGVLSLGHMNETHSTDAVATWTRGVQAGDERAFRALFDALYHPMLRFAGSLVRDPGVAEDLVQEAFVRLWDRRERLDVTQSLRAYLFRSVRNLAFNHRRDDQTHQRLLSDAAIETTAAAPGRLPAPDEVAAGSELALQLDRWLAALPPRQREALIFSRVEGMSHLEVAEAMGCSPRTVNNHLVAALATLKRHVLHAGALLASLSCMLS